MNEYLKAIKRVVVPTVNNVLGVVGNESVDLDSAVSSLALAFHLHNNFSASRVIPAEKRRSSFHILPIINCPRIELPFKTEVTYWLRKHQIELENLICRDEINFSQNVENLILVDHHNSPHHEKVISVIDHRPYDSSSNLSEDCAMIIEEVGSCATLIMQAIKSDEISNEILKLLYGPIVLDTINFSREADKVRELDFAMVEFIERKLCIQNPLDVRKELFDELVAARADISSLNSLQLLSKDLKIITGGNYRVAIPGVDVFNYVSMKNAEKSVKDFADRENIDVVMLMGMRPTGISVERMLGIVNIKNEKLYAEIVEAVKKMENPALNLVQKDINFMNGEFFQQENIQASRKQILPVIKTLLSARNDI